MDPGLVSAGALGRRHRARTSTATVQFRRYGGDLAGPAGPARLPAGARRHRAVPQPGQRRALAAQVRRPQLPPHRPQLRARPARRRSPDGGRGPDRSGDVAVDRGRQPVPRAGARGPPARHAHHHGLLVEPHRDRVLGLAGRAWRTSARRGSPTGTRSSGSTTPRRRTPTSSATADGSACPGCRSGRRSAGRAGKTHGPIEGNLVPGVRDHVFNVTRRWLDPDGDGDPSDGVDGFRLDVAEMVPLGFWRDYRRFVRSINPEAYLVGEVWWRAVAGPDLGPGAVAPGRRVRRGDELPLVHADARLLRGAPSRHSPPPRTPRASTR